MEQLQTTTRAMAQAVTDPATRARVDQVIRSTAFAQFKKAMPALGDGKAAHLFPATTGETMTAAASTNSDRRVSSPGLGPVAADVVPTRQHGRV
jgi:hypothetical protein